MKAPELSVVILNYNGNRWLEPCFRSLQEQTLADRIEVIVADNASTDGSGKLCEDWAPRLPGGRYVDNQANLGFCEGNNRGAAVATGEWLLFLNNDTWLEPDCLERLLEGARLAGASAAMPRVLNYPDDSFQSDGAQGMDVFGLTTCRHPVQAVQDVLMPEGCAYLIRRDCFEALGGFDARLFMYSDEYDLSLRVWLSGGRAVAIPGARLHHRGAAQVNPAGGGNTEEFRTSDTKRYLANRNSLFILWKNGSDLLLAMAWLQSALYLLEAMVALALTRRWSHVERAYWQAWRDARRLAAEPATVPDRRTQTDLSLLRFLRLRPNRWDELVKLRKHGTLHVTPDKPKS